MLRLRFASYLILASGLMYATVERASAQAWNNFAGGNWSVAANWTPGAPVFGPTATIAFGSTPPQLPPTSSFQPTGNYTATADGATPYTVNTIFFNGFGSCDVGTNGIVLTTNNAAGGIAFAGSGPAVFQNGTGSVVFTNGTATNDTQLTTGLTVGGLGTGHVTFAGVISGTGDLTINHFGTSPMNSGGQIFLAPGATGGNTFAGDVILNNGNLTLNTTNAPIAAGQSLIINGGTVRGSSSFTLGNAVTLNSQLHLVGVVAPNFNGIISGDGGIFYNPSATITATFNNSITGTGPITVQGVGTNTPTFTLGGASGTATAASGYFINYGTFTVTNATATLPRLNPTAPLILNSAALNLTAGPGGTMTETVSATVISGSSLMTMTPTGAGGVVFNGGLVVRPFNGQLQVNVSSAGQTLGGPIIGGPNNATLLFSNVTAGDNINGVLPWAAAFIHDGATAGSLVRYDNALGIQPLSRTTDYVQSLPNVPYALPPSPTLNYRLQSTGNSFGAFNNNIVLNSMLIETPSAAGSLGGSLYGSGAIFLTSGTLATSLVGGTTQPTFTGFTITKAIVMPPGVRGNFHTQAFTTLLGPLNGNAGLTKSAAGQMWLLADNSGLAGGLTVNGAAILFEKNNNLGAPGSMIFMGAGAGTALSQLQFNPNSQFGAANTPTVSVNRPLMLIDGGAGLLATNPQNGIFNYDGRISGNGRLVKSFIGAVYLNDPTNDYTGDTVILQGSLVVTSDGNLGSSSSNIVLSSTGSATNSQALLTANASFSTNRNILITTTTASANGINTNGPGTTLVFNGHIGGSQTGVPFFKVGDGNLILTANNTFNGAYVQGDAVGSVARRHGGGTPQTGGTVTLTGVEGAMSAATAYTLNAGSTLILDNSSVPNFNRLASRQVTMNGADLRMIGSPTGDVFEHIGLSATAGLTNGIMGNTVSLNQPGFGGFTTTLVATSLQTSMAGGIMFFRGTNLGAASGDRTNVIFVAAPTLINGIMAQTLYADGAGAAPQDFAIHSPTLGVQRFTAYAALPASGSTATTTYSHTGALTLTGAATVNALKIDNGAIDMGTFSMTIGSGTQSGMLLSTGLADVIGTTSTATVNLAFGTQTARISVNNQLDVGSVANPVGLTGTGGLNKFGPGTLNLSRSTITGPHHISGGTLRALTTAAIAAGQTINIQPTAVLDINNLGTLATPFGPVALAGFGAVNIGTGVLGTGAASQNFAGSLVGSGAILNTGTSTQTLNGNSPLFSGDVQILAGILAVEGDVIPSDPLTPGPLGTGTTPVQLGNTTGTAGATLTLNTHVTRFERDIFVPAGSTGLRRLNLLNARVTEITGNIVLGTELRLDGPGSSTLHTSGATTITGIISESGGTGSIDWFGGNYNIWGNNTYTGRTFINSYNKSVLGIGHNNALGTGVIQFDTNSTLFVGTLRADNGPRVLANPLQFDGTTANATVGFSGQNDLTFTGPVAFGGAIRIFEVTNTGITTFSGNFTQSGGAAGITKTGGGTLDLRGDNSALTGAFTVNGGRLRVNNTAGSATGSGTVTVNNSGTLGGNGFIAGAVVVNAGGTIDPGNSIGTLTINNNVTLANNSNYLWEINGYTPVPAPFNSGGSTDLSNHDQIASTGTFTGGDFFFRIVELGAPTFSLFTNYSWTVATAVGTPTLGTVTIDVSQAPTFAPHTLNLTLDPATGQVNLNLFVVPEPTTVLGFIALGAGAVGMIRRRKKKATAAV